MSAFPIEGLIVKSDSEIKVSEAMAGRFKRVLRIRPGHIEKFIDNSGLVYHARCSLIAEGELSFTIEKSIKPLPKGTRDIKIILLLGIPAQNYLNEILSYSSQLDLSEVHIFPGDHSPRGLNAALFEKKKARFETILAEGRIPAERFKRPEIKWFCSLGSALERYKQSYKNHILIESKSPGEQNDTLYLLKDQIRNNDDLAFLILAVGPEGGLSGRESKILKEKNSMGLTIGDGVMKTAVVIPALLGALKVLLDEGL